MNAEFPEDDYLVQRRRREEAHERFLTQLFCAEDWLDRQAPQPIRDMEALLGEHAAQLRNAARFLMGRVAAWDQDDQVGMRAAMALSNIARTNVAIAKALREDAEKSGKTVHGVAVPVEPQD